MGTHKIQDFIINNQLISYFLVVLIISWSFWIPMALAKLNIIDFPVPIIIGSTIGAFSPLITLIIFQKLTKEEISLSAIFSTIKPNKEQIIWLTLAVLIIPFSQVIGNIFYFLSGQQSSLIIMNSDPLQVLGFWLFIIIPITFFATLLGSPLGEEPGWRGFATTRIQSKFGLHIGSFLLGSFWWMWHQPINIANGLNITPISYITMLLSSFIYDSLFNLSNKRILTPMFAHSSSFITSTYLFIDPNNWWAVGFLLLFVLSIRVYEVKKRKVITITQEIG